MSTAPTWDRIRTLANLAAHDKGEWAGAPIPVHGIPLVVEPRYPFAGLNGMAFYDEAHPEPDGDPMGGIKVINSWYSVEKQATVYVCEDEQGRFAAVLPEYGSKKLNYWIMTGSVAVTAWSLEAEFAAMSKLRSLTSETQFRAYILTGAFIETSKRSRAKYLFRKGRPTIVLSNDGQKILAALCLHPIGYYQGTWAGAQVPTDDVIAHLLYMRGDEPGFWRKANHHRVWEAQAGL